MKQLANILTTPYSFIVDNDEKLIECSYKHREFNRFTSVFKYWFPQSVITWLDSLPLMTQIFIVDSIIVQGYTIFTIYTIA